ncbi:MAG TPA: hypothetical protein VFE05_16645 [Longimicrobiaceae bacterium]|jgi:hypothetical protein|nr:hypothetical protein [Longimicrobiaceae bacterium]
MTFTTGVRPPHLADGDLLRTIDRQLDLEGSRRVRGHLASCASCAARLRDLDERSRLVREHVAELPVQLPDPSRRALALAAMERTRRRRSLLGTSTTGGTLLKVAAVLLVFITAAMGTSPGREWLGERVAVFAGPEPDALSAALLRLLHRKPLSDVRAVAADGVAGRGPAAPGPLTAAPKPKPLAPPAPPPPVSFSPEGTEVLLEFETMQAAGGATLHFGDMAGATAQIVSGAGGEKLVALPDGIQVRNSRRSRAEYMIELPNRFRVVRVRVAKRQETLIRVSPGKRDWLWTIELRSSAL